MGGDRAMRNQVTASSTDPAARDLKPASFPKLSWKPGEYGAALERVFDYVTGVAGQAVDWYMRKKRPKKVGGWLFRGAAILATALAGLIPVLGELIETGGVPVVRPAWSTVALGIAGILVLLDRFLGLTRGWVRFMVAGQEIGEKLEAFRMDWEAGKLAWKQAEPDAEEARAMLEKAKAFLLQVHGVVRQETMGWADEFQKALQETDQAAREAVERKRLGAITVRVTNGEQLPDGWRLSVDDSPPRIIRGAEAAVRNLTPEIHVVRVTGKAQGNEQSIEKPVAVEAGQITAVSLTL